MKTNLKAKKLNLKWLSIAGISAVHRRIKLNTVLHVVTNGSNMYISGTHAKSREAWEKPGLHRFAVFSSPGPAVLPVTSRDLSLETADPRES